jgi:hypothetical protein
MFQWGAVVSVVSVVSGESVRRQQAYIIDRNPTTAIFMHFLRLFYASIAMLASQARKSPFVGGVVRTQPASVFLEVVR